MKMKDFINSIAEDMNNFEMYEAVVFHLPEREAAMDYMIRCLANPMCEGSEEALDKIMKERESKRQFLSNSIQKNVIEQKEAVGSKR